MKKSILTSLILSVLIINSANAQMSQEIADEIETVAEATNKAKVINSSKNREELLRAQGYVPKSEMKFPKSFKTFDNLDIVAKNQIELYISNFSISRNMNGLISCSMQFHVNNDTLKKISLLSYKVKWDGLSTAINIRNVLPRQNKFQKYTLLGEGCYNADKTPKITVNRCRIKGMSQDKCANKIRWKKSN